MVEQRCRIRTPVSIPGTLRPTPSLEDNASMTTEVPTVEQLGFEPAPEKDERAVMPFEGGETAGLKRVRQYIWDEDRLRIYKETRNGLLGSDFSSKFSPWLALGCLSPKTIVSEVQQLVAVGDIFYRERSTRVTARVQEGVLKRNRVPAFCPCRAIICIIS